MKSSKRFLTILWAILVALLLLLFFTTAFDLMSPCSGAEPGRITISEPVVFATSYPSEVYSMTDAEFFKWATKQNEQARAESEDWYKNESQPRWIGYGTATDYERSRRGRYFGTNYEQGSVHTYEKRYLNPNYTSRLLKIVNPFCRPTEKNQ